jgi:hypothetical protein
MSLTRELFVPGRRRASVLIAIGALAATAAVLCIFAGRQTAGTASANAGGVKSCPADGRSVDFDQYSLGDSFAGLRRSAVLRRCDAPDPTHGESLGANYVTSIYGDCLVTVDEGCAPPLEVQTWPACERNFSVYTHEPEGLPLNPSELFDVRGARAAAFDNGTRLEVYTGDATVVIFADDRDQVRAAAESLTGQTSEGATVGPADPLPAPAAGALVGHLAC